MECSDTNVGIEKVSVEINVLERPERSFTRPATRVERRESAS